MMERKSNIFRDILFIFPVMGYYALEALIVGVVIALVWRIFMTNDMGSITYPQIVVLYWIAKMVLFNVFNLIGSLGTMEDPNKNNEE